LAYLLVLPGSRARIVRCGGRYDPQLVKRSSEWVSMSMTRLACFWLWRITVLLCVRTLPYGVYTRLSGMAASAVIAVRFCQQGANWSFSVPVSLAVRCVLSRDVIFNYYRVTRMHSADYAVARCLSVRPFVPVSVRPSHAGIQSKRLNISSSFLHHWV